jgi:drug/metabolite transporter (DMT)-like permease
MGTVGTIVVVALSLGLLATAVLLLRVRPSVPWPAIIAAAVASGICFTVGGDASEDGSGPDLAIVMGSVVGFLCVVAAIVALIPRRSGNRPPSRVPFLLSVGATALGGAGLLVSRLAG